MSSRTAEHVKAFTRRVDHTDAQIPGNFESLADDFLKIDTPEARNDALDAIEAGHPDLAYRLRVMCQELGMF